MNKRKFTIYILLLSCLALVTFIGSNISWQLDFTHDKVYTLSSGSQNILNKIDDPVVLKFYYSQGLEDLPVWLKNYAGRVERILEQYEKHADGKLSLEIINPEPDTEEQEEAIRYGLRGQTLPGGEELYFGLVALQAEKSDTIPVFSPDREEFLEYDISQTIFEVQQIVKPKLGLITSLPIIAPVMPNNFMMQQRPSRNWVFGDEMQRTYEVITIEKDVIPDDIDVLAVIHPKNVSKQLEFAIDQFLLQGKPVFMAVDPSSYYERSQQRQASPMNTTSSDLHHLISNWGITFDSAEVVGDFQLAYQLENMASDGGPLRFPVWMTFRKFSSESPAVAQLENVLILESGAFRLHKRGGLTVQPLLQTTEQSGTMMASSLAFTLPDNVAAQINIDKQVRTIAGIITGQFSTAFPKGKPPLPGSVEEEFADVIPEDENNPSLKESVKPGRLVLFCDVDFLADEFSIQRGNFLGMDVVQPINDNIALASNTLDLLGGSDDLISIRGKGNTLRSFTTIEEMRFQANEKFKARLEAVENRVTEIQNSIRDLQGQGQLGNALVASPEVLEAIEKLQVEEANARAERRVIRKELREDIENLGVSLAVLNLLPVPLLLILCGTFFFYRRNKRNKS